MMSPSGIALRRSRFHVTKRKLILSAQHCALPVGPEIIFSKEDMAAAHRRESRARRQSEIAKFIFP
jgi:hypothetical protein